MLRYLACAFVILTVVGTAGAQSPDKATIFLTGRATVEAFPDAVVIRLSVSEKAPTMAGALDKVSVLARKTIDFSKSFTSGDIEIETEGLTADEDIEHEFDQATRTNKQVRKGYRARTSITVKLKQLQQAGTFLRKVVDLGPVSIQGLTYTLSDQTKVIEEAQSLAVKDAARSAAILAAAADRQIGELVRIVYPPRQELRESGSGPGVIKRAPRSPPKDVPIEIGKISISVAVDTEWSLKAR